MGYIHQRAIKENSYYGLSLIIITEHMYWYKSFVCTYVTMYVQVSLCMYVCHFVCTCVSMYVKVSLCMHMCHYVSTYVTMYVQVSLCMYVCHFVCMCVTLYVCVSLCMYLCIHTTLFITFYTYGGICIMFPPFLKTSVKFCERLLIIFYFLLSPYPLFVGGLYFIDNE